MSLNDSQVLKGDPTFIGRVESSMLAFAQQVAGEDPRSIVNHTRRAEYAAQVVNNPEAFKLQFAAVVAINATVVSDATANGTVVLTPGTGGNVATQQALALDTDINNAVAASWNTFAGFG